MDDESMFIELPEHRLIYPRKRATSLTDGTHYVYILGSVI